MWLGSGPELVVPCHTKPMRFLTFYLEKTKPAADPSEMTIWREGVDYLERGR